MKETDELLQRFLDLPTDPEEAFAAFFQFEYKNLEKSRDDDTWYAEREFVDNMLCFDGVYKTNLYEDLQESPTDTSKFSEYFQTFLRQSKMRSMQIKLEQARRIKSGEVGVIVLDTGAKQAIRRLIDAIKEKLEETDIPENKRRSLFNKINAFANEIDQNLTRTETLFTFIVQATRTAKEAGIELKPITDRIDRILDMVDSAKKWADSLPPWDERKKLPPTTKRLEGPPDQHEGSANSDPLF